MAGALVSDPAYVWIVMTGEDYEGGSCVAVCSTHAAAVARALAEPRNFSGPWRPWGEDSWKSNGCDYVTVTRMEVLS